MSSAPRVPPDAAALAERAPEGKPAHASGRRWPIGAEVVAPDRTHFRVWAPQRRRVEVVPEGVQRSFALASEGNGYFSAAVPVGPGTRYRFRLDGEQALYPDPASRFQPDGPHGPSEVVDPASFRWTDAG